MTVVAFSVFGSDDQGIYFPGMIRNLEMYQEFHPDWKIAIYAGPAAAKYLQPRLHRFRMAEIRRQVSPETQSATFWRFRALVDYKEDFYLFRDADSRPIARERGAVAEWMSSGKNYHVIRDHKFHYVPMLAGLWGCNQTAAARIGPRLPKVLKRNYYGVDQQFLQTNVWMFARQSLYSSVDCEHIFGSVVNPIRGNFDEGFCGQDLDGYDQPRKPENNRGKFRGIVSTHEEGRLSSVQATD